MEYLAERVGVPERVVGVPGRGGWSTWEREVGVPGRGELEYLGDGVGVPGRGELEYLGDGVGVPGRERLEYRGVRSNLSSRFNTPLYKTMREREKGREK